MKESELSDVMRQPWRRDKRVDTVIGIDTGVKTGFSAWSKKDSSFSLITTLNFWSVYDHCLAYPKDTTKIIIEQSTTSHIWGGRLRGKSPAACAKLGGDVARPHLMAELLENRLTGMGYYVIKQKPSNTKMNAAAFKRLTGYEGRTNEHTRDSGIIAFKG